MPIQTQDLIEILDRVDALTRIHGQLARLHMIPHYARPFFFLTNRLCRRVAKLCNELLATHALHTDPFHPTTQPPEGNEFSQPKRA